MCTPDFTEAPTRQLLPWQRFKGLGTGVF